MPKLSVVLLGPAGSGKTHLTSAFGRWLENLGFSVGYVNLDPSVEYLPYEPFFDARSVVRTRDLLELEALGPNAAIVRAIDILAEKSALLYEALRSVERDYVLVDTPGQMEIVIFRSSGLKLVRTVRRASVPVGVFLLDSTLGRWGIEAAISILLSTVAQLRLDVPVVPVLSKSDAAKLSGGYASPSLHAEVDEILKNLGSGEVGLLSEMLFEVLSLAKKYLKSGRLIAVSSITGEGLEELYKVVHETFCACGDLT
ncbi:MAG: ATP/GTP-binding protein [Sulfolobales archaeon]|nr:ATP/GTP-binding protein [Sulfolobales archaeon]MDW8010129.1 ATP/GTP-binding protein [Sulfolobales archaeon]